MTQQQLIDYAIKGIKVEINELDECIIKGQRILRDRDNGIYTDKSPLHDYEIRDIVSKKQVELKELLEKQSDLEWRIV